MNAQEKLEMIKKGKLSPEENIKNFLEAIKKDDKQGKKINSILELNPNALLEAKEVCSKLKIGKAGRLAGLAIAAKSNISVKRI